MTQPKIIALTSEAMKRCEKKVFRHRRFGADSPMSKPELRVFVLADTHNRLPANLESFVKAADEIWHMGDVCDPILLDELEATGKPVTIVRGNCDSNFDWPLTVDLERCGLRFHLVHVPPSKAPNECDVLLHGHTHIPRNELQSGVRFLNPGCVTRPNRGAPASIAFLELTRDGNLTWQLELLR